MNSLLPFHLAAVVLAGFAVWSMRHERSETATGRGAWVLPVVLAIAVAAILLIVSPGKRVEFWMVGIGVGFAVGLGAGTIVKVNMDFERKLVRVHRTWDGMGAAALLLLLAVARIIASDLTKRQSTNSGLLGAIAAFLAAYLLGRALTMYFFNARRTIHLDMIQRRKAPTG